MRRVSHIEKTFSYLGYISNVIGSTILLVIVGHFLIGATIFIKHSVQNNGDHQAQSTSGDRREILPVYDNYPNNSDFWKEHLNIWGSHFEPYYHWRRNGFQGKYINVSSEGIRNTVITTKSSKNAKNIFMFGGSTLWGTGSKDKHTIPSFVQAMLGKDYKIYNYGETGYVSTQELNFLLKQLAEGNVPDMVVFYDGVNDGYAGVYSPAIPRDVQNLRMQSEINKNKSIFFELYKKSNYKRLIDFFSKNTEKWDNEISSKIKNNSASVVKLYEAHIRQVKALGKEYGFETFFFWQPNLFSGERDTFPHEKRIIQNSSLTFIESQRQLYLYAKSAFTGRDSEKIFFLGDIFNQVNEPLYIDWCHIGPNGNKIIAQQIFNNIKVQVQ